jgi:hypothetical protein
VAVLDPDGVFLALYAADVPSGRAGPDGALGDGDGAGDGRVTARAVAVFVG